MQTETKGRVFTPNATLEKIAEECGIALGQSIKDRKIIYTATLDDRTFAAEDNTRLLIEIIRGLK